MIGVHDARTPAAVIRAFPGAVIGREFVAGEQPAGDLRPKFAKLSAPWLAAGGQVYVSVKPRVADVTSGAWTSWMRQLGVWLGEHPGVKVIIWHEPEDDLGGPAFAAMFNTVREAIKAGWSGATVAYCAMAYHWRPGGNAGRAPAGWQKVVADEYLVDVYSGVSFPETLILPEHPGFTGWFDAIVRPKLADGKSVSWGMAERGFQAKDPAVRAATIRREADWLASLPAAGATARRPAANPAMLYLAWNTGGTEGDSGWLLDPAGEEAMRYLLAQVVAAGTPPAPVAPAADSHDQAYGEGVAAGRASRDAEVEQARAAGYAAAIAEVMQWAATKTSNPA